ncbi:hypothetical protein K461DRAFT_294491 [Myriangium duriaei CBS 260.36]|uniref:Uncharacterized protein n=1 Tax=Myriangium duriaei CBS 260.36 TaxID=1168546 RepID=A0A9P4MFY7_9PEZI|nr:hypothetical protein K461DRAFT_294491 [Myriangium duriaei CBS 260.36]
MKLFLFSILTAGVIAGTIPVKPWHPCELDTMYDEPQCCDFNTHKGKRDTGCGRLGKSPSSLPDFRKQCAAKKKMPKCCNLGSQKQALFCTDPPGIPKVHAESSMMDQIDV